MATILTNVKPRAKLYVGDNRKILFEDIAEGSVQCCVTSPPYFNQRDYGVAGQIGLEPSLDDYVFQLKQTMRGVHKVLRDDGTLWLNLGDKYGQGKQLLGAPWAVADALRSADYAGRIPNDRDRSWLAAMLDGEGTICGFWHVRKDDGNERTGINLFVTNSCQNLIEKLHTLWPASRQEHMKPGEGHFGNRQCLRWIVHGIENKIDFISEIYPYLVSKRKQAIVAYNTLLLMRDAKKLGHSPQKNEVLKKRKYMMALLSDLNKAKCEDVPSWMKEPPPLHNQPLWILRSDIIWHRVNAMPGSQRDRPTCNHEYIFLFTKQTRYYYDDVAVQERAVEGTDLGILRGKGWKSDKADSKRINAHSATIKARLEAGIDSRAGNPSGMRSKRTVWSVPVAGERESHFAVFPPRLILPCILAGTSAAGRCPSCGCPYNRVTERERVATRPGTDTKVTGNSDKEGNRDPERHVTSIKTTGWEPGCDCNAGDPLPCIVLDPFAGSGTTMYTAMRKNRWAIGIELNPEYAEIIRRKIARTKQTRGFGL